MQFLLNGDSGLLTLPAMESEAKAGSPRKASARACRRRGGRGLTTKFTGGNGA